MKNLKEKIRNIVESSIFNNFILFVIILNSILLGLLTYPDIADKYESVLHITCEICVIIFTIEIFLKLYVYKTSFFKDGWNNFDFFLVAISWIPTQGAFSSFRAFRVLRTLRTLRLVTRLERLRLIVQAIIESIPNVAWASVLLLLVFYVFAIMGTTMFQNDFDEFFGTIGKSMFSLFQIMTLESWSMGVARPVIAKFPFAWIYFISFILVSSFIVMNVIIGIVVNAISELSEKEKLKKEQNKIQTSSEIKLELEKLKEQIRTVEILLEKNS